MARSSENLASSAVNSLPSLNFAPLSILRNGNDFTLTGDLPDLNVKTALLNALKAAFGSGVNLIDKLNIKAGVSSPDFSGLGGLFKAAVDVPDFNFNIEGGTLTLSLDDAGDDELSIAVAEDATVPVGAVLAEIGEAAEAGAPAAAPAAPAAAPATAPASPAAAPDPLGGATKQ